MISEPLKTTARFHGGTHVVEVLITLVATAGGVAKYLHESMKNSKPFKFVEFIAKAFISAFVGWVGAHFSMSIGLTGDSVLVFASIFGWLGADGAEILVSSMKGKFLPPNAR